MATRSEKWRLVVEVELDHEATVSEVEYDLAQGLTAGIAILSAKPVLEEKPGFMVQRG